MKIVIDMNLSPAWVQVLKAEGHEAVHWSNIGAPTEKDRMILRWAKDRNHILFTHDLDFGAILAASQADAPSVIQIRTQDPSPAHGRHLILPVLTKFADELTRGVLITVDERRTRLSMLPLLRNAG